MNVVSDDIFSADLNEDQQNLKDSIELFVKASKNKDKKTGCHILEMYNDMLKETFQYGPEVPLVQVPCSEGTTKTDVDNATQKNEKDSNRSKSTQNKETVEEKRETDIVVPEILNEIAVDKEETKATQHETSDQRDKDMEIPNDGTDVDETDILSDAIQNDDVRGSEKDLHEESIFDKKVATDDHIQDREGEILPTDTKKNNTVESQLHSDEDPIHEQDKNGETKVHNDNPTNLDREDTKHTTKVGKSTYDFKELVTNMRSIITETHVFQTIRTLEKDRDSNTKAAKPNPKNHILEKNTQDTQVTNEDIESEEVKNIQNIKTLEGEHVESIDVNNEDQHKINNTSATSHQHNTTYGICFSTVCVKMDIFSIYMSVALLLPRKDNEQNIDEVQLDTSGVVNVTRKDNAKDADSVNAIPLEGIGKDISKLIEKSEIHAKQKLHSRKRNLTKCPQKRSCNRPCHLLYSFRHCLSIDEQTQQGSNRTENIQTLVNVLQNTTRKHTRKSHKKKCHQRRSCNDYCYLVYMLRHCLPADRLNDPSEAASDFDNREHKADEDHDNKDMLDKKINVTNYESMESITEKLLEKELNDKSAKQSAARDKQNKKKETDFNPNIEDFPFERLEKMINIQTDEYGRKIQTLELMIIKLENQVLFEKLDKQNHSSTIMRLENMILKLENDLLRMYKNYETLKQEGEKCSKQHNRFLEIIQQQETKFKTYPELPDKTSESLELISKHEQMIKDLSRTISNQSIILDNLRSKSELLEEQSNILRQMITNQTVFMNQIVQQVANLTEQNMKYRGELDNIRQIISNINSSKPAESASNISDSETFVEKLDSLASEGKISIDNIEINSENKHRVGSPDTFCNHSCMLSRVKDQSSCHYYSVVAGNVLIPFKTLFWEKCSYGSPVDNRTETDDVDLPIISDSEIVKLSESKEKTKVTNHEGISDLITDKTDSAQDHTVQGKENIEHPIPIDVLENHNDTNNEFQDHSKTEDKQMKPEQNLKADQNHETTQLDSLCNMTQINIFESLCKFKCMPFIHNKTHSFVSDHIMARIKYLQESEDTFGSSDKPSTAKSENKQTVTCETKDDKREEESDTNKENEQGNPMDIPKNQNFSKENEENILKQESPTNQHQADSVSDDEEKSKENLNDNMTRQNTNLPENQEDKTPDPVRTEKNLADARNEKTEQTNSKQEKRPEAKETNKDKKVKLPSYRKTPIYLNRQQKEPKGEMVSI